MVLVLVLLGIFILFLLLFVLLLFSTLKVNVKHMQLENILLPKITYDYEIQIGAYLFSKIPIITFTTNKQKLQKAKVIQKIKKIQISKKMRGKLDPIKTLKLLSPKIEALKLDLALGTEDAFYTATIVFLTSLLLSLSLPHVVERKNYKKIKYEITPLYSGKNSFHFKFQSIFYVKMVHIMNIIYIYLRKRREEENERTSNRRAYANSHEQYPRYGRCKYHYRGTN